VNSTADDALQIQANLLSDVFHSASKSESFLQNQANTLADEYAARPVDRPGIFKVGDAFFAVKRNKAGTHFYAKKLVGKSWEYSAGAIYNIREANRLSVAACEALSLQMGSCCWCSRELTAADSVKRGIGPICRKRVGGFE
jgi:hypothetical protein